MKIYSVSMMIVVSLVVSGCASSVGTLPEGKGTGSYAVLVPNSISSPFGVGPGITSLNGTPCSPSSPRSMCAITLFAPEGALKLAGRFESSRTVAGGAISWRELPFTYEGKVDAGYVYSYGPEGSAIDLKLVLRRLCKSNDLSKIQNIFLQQRAKFRDFESFSRAGGDGNVSCENAPS
jgi:hypothetical protein